MVWQGSSMKKGSFQKIEKSKERMYGPRKLLVCGYSVEEQQPFVNFLETTGFGDLPVVFVHDEQENLTLKQLLEKPHKSGAGRSSTLRRAAILCGFTQEEIHRILSAYRQSEYPKQLWATLTPVSENWTISGLLEELHKEAEAMRRDRK